LYYNIFWYIFLDIFIYTYLDKILNYKKFKVITFFLKMKEKILFIITIVLMITLAIIKSIK